METLRLQVLLAKANVASRRAAETIIAEGRVSVNGEIVTEMGVRVPLDAEVCVDGNPVFIEKQKYYVALHKPEGMLVSESDPLGRPLASDILRSSYPARLYHVGRLDYHSSGLIFYTNDGDFAQAMTHPSHEMEKEYIIKVDKPLNKRDLQEALRGVVVGKGRERATYKIVSYTILSNKRCQLILREGKNREIRKLMEHFGYQVQSLKRIRIGSYDLGSLRPGEYSDIKSHQVLSLLREAKK